MDAIVLAFLTEVQGVGVDVGGVLYIAVGMGAAYERNTFGVVKQLQARVVVLHLVYDCAFKCHIADAEVGFAVFEIQQMGQARVVGLGIGAVAQQALNLPFVAHYFFEHVFLRLYAYRYGGLGC